MRLLASVRITRVALALVVAFWMAGAGCLLGCESMIVAASNVNATPAGAPTIIAAGEACASMRSHNCCAKHGRKQASTSSATSSAQSEKPQTETPLVIADLSGTSGSMMDCPLAMNATAALSKAKPDQSSGELLLARTSAFIPSFREQVSALSTPARLPNRGHTYLHCCVFLI